MVSKRYILIAMSMSVSPIGDHLFSPPSECPIANTIETTEAALRSTAVVMMIAPPSPGRSNRPSDRTSVIEYEHGGIIERPGFWRAGSRRRGIRMTHKPDD